MIAGRFYCACQPSTLSKSAEPPQANRKPAKGENRLKALSAPFCEIAYCIIKDRRKAFL